MHNSFYQILGTERSNRKEVITISKRLGISVNKLDYYNDGNILPSNYELRKISEYLDKPVEYIILRMGAFDHRFKSLIAQNADLLSSVGPIKQLYEKDEKFSPIFKTGLGELYNGDCIKFLRTVEDEKFDLIFADPPFNLSKIYLSEIDDDLDHEEYISWTEDWLAECVRTLKEGGSLFIWNLPKWNSYLSAFLNKRLNFRHWIATDIKYSLPISKRLYPSHYSLLYYVKGPAAKAFHPDRLPMDVCPKCYADLKDYGGYKDKMNPNGINLTDIWYDIPPVRHHKYKRRKEANELSIKLLDRILEMSSNKGDLIFDPFGGAGTTYIVAEIKERRWMGIELGPCDDIIERFNVIDEESSFLVKYRKNYNRLFNEKVKAARQQKNLWTDESFPNNK
jgi:site-specific DNA-methyltransferase (adenine-specific)